METLMLDNDIRVLCVTAAAYPQGIADAHQRLHATVPYSSGRKYFGLSRPESGEGIVYHAAAEELMPGEAEKYKCHTRVIKKGKYITLALRDYMKDLHGIESAFRELLSTPGLDPEGYCVEWYISNKELKCMIRLNS